jgi:quercetin dioxygenase-like cupin family protein
VPEQPPINRVNLLSAVLAEAPPVERVEVARVELAPGQPAGRHFHPCDVVGYVVSGSIHFEIAGEAGIVLAAGDAFHEPANREIARFDNASGEQPATFIACYLLPPGEQRLIEML